MKNLYVRALLAVLSMGFFDSYAQVTDTTHYNYGIWQTFGEPVDHSSYPEVLGRLSNFRWADLEPSNNVWNWTEFDENLTQRAQDGLPIIFMVYTKEDAPEWIYDNGVPKVTEKDDKGTVTGHSPYYNDADYKSFFKRMISRVHDHIETLPEYVRKQIIAVQPCFGSTGDYISYKGTVPSQYELTGAEFYTLFREFTMYYFDEYKFTTPKIYLLSNPQNSGSDQTFWLMGNCPNGWIKTGTLGKGFQLNDEKEKGSWLLNILNQPQTGNYIRARSEVIGAGLSSGWWNAAPYKNMFGVMCYAIFWGLDWSNQNFEHIEDHSFDPAFAFYNKYAGHKDPAKSNNAMCALKDVLDAADGVRFPAAEYGAVSKTASRFNNIVAPYAAYGAKLEDVNSAMLTEQDNLVAKGTNDVGWNLFEGNYDRFLHQVKANESSAGYWNVESAEPNTMHGKFARGFDLAKGKDALYFDLDDAFLNNAALDAAYPIMIEVTYLDKGTGSWQLMYDGKSNANKSSLSVTCTNSNKWKTTSITINDAYFANRGLNSTDFYIKNTGSENVLFSLVELSRSGTASVGSSLFYSNAVSFDTVCVNSVSAAKQVSISGQFLNNSPVTVGPLKGFTFSVVQEGGFSDSLIISDYGASFSQSVYVKFNPAESRSYSSVLNISGGGAPSAEVSITAVGFNSSPDLSSSIIKTVSCYNAKDGSIDLRPAGGKGPFTYSWVNNTTNFRSSNEDINALIPSAYTVNISASYGCKSSAEYVISQPEVLVTNVTSDAIICRGGTSNVYVTATGGTAPYTGTGTFTVNPGYKTYTVTDKNGCTDNQGYTNKNGTSKAPLRPGIIDGADAEATGVCGAGNYTYSISAVANATTYNWTAPAKSSIASTSNGGRTIILNTIEGFNGGTLKVTAGNACGTSEERTESLSSTPEKPGGISGPKTVKSNQTGNVYSVGGLPGLNYTWTVPTSAKIVSGQNTSSITVTWGTKDGNISVAAKNNCATSYKTSLSVSVKNTSGFTMGKATPEDNALKVSPNPAHDITYLSFPANSAFRYTIELTDMTGKVVLRKSGIAMQGFNSIMLNVAALRDGLLNVTVTNNDTGEKLATKLVKG